MSTTDDAFLNGRLRIRQPKDGYRAGADPVFLAAAVPVKAGQSVLELGCGAGVAMLCLLSRVPGIQAVGIDKDRDALRLASENIAENGYGADVSFADIPDLPDDLRQRSFDHVMTNPPFFDRTAGSKAANAGREAGRGESTALSVWIDVAIRRLSPNGTLSIIQRAERLPDCLRALDERVGDICVLPLVPRADRAAKLVVLQAKKGGKGPFRLSAPMVLHKGATHEKDGDSYTEVAARILRHGAPLALNC